MIILLYLDNMTGTNSSNDRLILRQNVEINSNEYFLATYFFGNEIVDHVVWKCHCAITKKNGFEFRVISPIHYGLSNEYRCKFSFIHHLLLLCHFPLKKSKLSVITEAFFFGEMCRSATASQVARMVNTNLEAQKLRLRQHQPFMSIKSFEQTQQVGWVTR